MRRTGRPPRQALQRGQQPNHVAGSAHAIAQQHRDAVAVLREQHMVLYDAPGAYLQGVAKTKELILLRPPREFRTWDERGVEIYWLMLVPIYGQAVLVPSFGRPMM